MAVDYGPQIAALTAAIAAGAQSVSYEGKQVSYRSLDDMLKTLAFLERQQAAANGTPQPTSSTGRFRSGYRPQWQSGWGYGGGRG